MNKRETHIVTGMTRDLFASRFDNKFVVDARNIRITSTKDNATLLSVTNEKGTGEFSITGTIEGVILGHAVLNKTLVLFSTEHITSTNADPIPDGNGLDRIYKLDFSDEFDSATATLLFEGNLNFYYKNPLETLPYYETDLIQKVYWVDGRNQPRMINICNGYQDNADIFNFNREIGNSHSIKVTKYDSGGEFPAGTIQYCFNYFNKFGQETNIVDVSPLYYLCPKDGGLPADGMSTCSFVINLEGLNTEYEYVRVYAIIRTSENAVPNARIIGDYKLGSLSYIGEFAPIESPVNVEFENLNILNSSTGEVVPLSDRYESPDVGETLEVRFDVNEYLYDSSTAKVYCFYSTRPIYGEFIKLPYINVANQNGTIQLKDNSRISELNVADYNSSSGTSVTVVDNGVVGSTIDASTLIFIGGQDFVAGTLTSKDNTLFLGDLKQKVPNISDITIDSILSNPTIKSFVRGLVEPCVYDYKGNKKSSFIATEEDKEFVSGVSFYSYPIDNNRSSYDMKGFKARENYRLGFIAQYKTGQWSDAVWLDDCDETYAPGRNVFYIENGNQLWGASYRKPGFKSELPSLVVNALLDAGFIRVAPVAVYPSESERKVVCQGILASTVYNVKDRFDKSPYAQSDWRFRSGYVWDAILDEIQCNPVGSAPQYPAAYDEGQLMSSDNFVKTFGNQYYRDPSILSFYSPDIEADKEATSSKYRDLKLRIVGVSNLGFNLSKKAIQAETVVSTHIDASVQTYLPSVLSIGKLPYLVTPESVEEYSQMLTSDYYHENPSLTFPGYLDAVIGEYDTNEGDVNMISDRLFKYTTFLWHRNGSLNNDVPLSAKEAESGFKQSGIYTKKIVSELRYARTTFFQTVNSFGNPYVNVPSSSPELVHEEDGLAMFDVGNLKKVPYYGTVDKVLAASYVNIPETTTIASGEGSDEISMGNGYPIEVSEKSNISLFEPTLNPSSMSFVPNKGFLIDDSNVDTSGYRERFYGKDPIQISYRSLKHLVVGLSPESPASNTLYQIGTPISNSAPFFWKDSGVASFTLSDVTNGDLTNSIGTFTGVLKDSVLVGELYRDFTNEQEAARFGGTSDEAVINNVWNRCGDSVKLNRGESVTLLFKEGDTYVGRYDCLKTYPYTEESLNQLIDIYSTEVESRVNLDARYDRLRGRFDNLPVRPRNFNLFNHPGYEQSNQFFTFKALDLNRYKSLIYPNTVTFSSEKKPGADVDIWTSIPLMSTFDLNGKLGKINKLEAFRDSIYAFQNRGIAQILFNERVQIPTSDGQPIEITNGLKFGGYRYLSDQIGMTNKWSLQTTPNGIYFIDDEKNTLYQFDGQQLQDLSGKTGFRTWLAESNSYDVWNPVEYGNFKTWYDRVNGDLYFMNKDESLVYSEQIGNFISFMDYGKLPLFVNMNDRFLSAKYNSTSGEDKIWELWAGQYNMFFSEYRPYWLTFISNTDPTTDKIFNNLSWRTFDYNSAGDLQPLSTFDTIRVWNDHQDTGDVALIDVNNKPSSLKKKFNVFRALVPRDKQGVWNGKGINRIRSVLAYIKLSRIHSNTDKMIFSDFDVDFFE